MATQNTTTKQGKAGKIGKLVRGTKRAQAPAPKAAKATKQAPAPKAAKATKQAKQAKAATRYAGRKITFLPASKTPPAFRGGRAARWALVVKAKTCADVLGARYTKANGTEGTFDSTNFLPFIQKGLISID